MRKLYEVVFYSGDQPIPAYYIIDDIECENSQEEPKNKLPRITQRVRSMFNIEDDIPDRKIHKSLYFLQENGLTPLKPIA